MSVIVNIDVTKKQHFCRDGRQPCIYKIKMKYDLKRNFTSIDLISVMIQFSYDRVFELVQIYRSVGKTISFNISFCFKRILIFLLENVLETSRKIMA